MALFHAVDSIPWNGARIERKLPLFDAVDSTPWNAATPRRSVALFDAVDSIPWNGSNIRRFTPLFDAVDSTPWNAANIRRFTPLFDAVDSTPWNAATRPAPCRYSTAWTPRHGMLPTFADSRRYSTPWTPRHGMVPGSSESCRYSTPWTPRHGMAPGARHHPASPVRRAYRHRVVASQTARMLHNGRCVQQPMFGRFFQGKDGVYGDLRRPFRQEELQRLRRRDRIARQSQARGRQLVQELRLQALAVLQRPSA